jgi:hypothetical protein
MDDDFEVAVPICLNIDYKMTGSKFAVGEVASVAFQGAIDSNPGGVPVGKGAHAEVEELNKISLDPPSKTDELALIHLGERVRSVRAVVKRYSNNGAFSMARLRENGAVPGNVYKLRLQYSNFPSYTGISWSSNPQIHQNANLDRVLLVPTCNWLTWFTPCYLMRRGSVRFKYYWKYQNGTGTYPIDWTVNNHAQSDGFVYAQTLVNFTNTSFVSERTEGYTEADCSFCGGDLVPPSLKYVLGFETPQQIKHRFYFAQQRDMETTKPDTDDGLFVGAHALRANISILASNALPSNLIRYVAAGDDFSLHCYKYPPLLIQTALY